MRYRFRNGIALRLALTISASLFLCCGDLLLSKEQKKVSDDIRRAVTGNPSSINAAYQDGEPPLHVALTNQLPGLVGWLLARGADPNLRDQRGDTAMHHAVFTGSNDHSAMSQLLEHGGDINSRDDLGRTPLHLAASSMYAGKVRWLLASGADAGARDDLGETPMHAASCPQPFHRPEDASGTIHELVAGGADVDARSDNGSTPLHKAALIGSADAARALLTEGAKVDLKDLGGRTALHVAAEFGRAGVVEVLLRAGADKGAIDDRGQSPLDLALQSRAAASGGQGTPHADTDRVIALLK